MLIMTTAGETGFFFKMPMSHTMMKGLTKQEEAPSSGPTQQWASSRSTFTARRQHPGLRVAAPSRRRTGGRGMDFKCPHSVLA